MSPNWTGDDGVSDYQGDKQSLHWKRQKDGSYRSGEYKIEPLTDSNEYVREWGVSVGHVCLGGRVGGSSTYRTLAKAKNAANRHAGRLEEPERKRTKKPDAATLAWQAQQPTRDAYAKLIQEFTNDYLSAHYKKLCEERALAEVIVADRRWRCAIIGEELTLRDAAGGHEALKKARARRDAEKKTV